MEQREPQPLSKLTIAEYLKFEESSQIKHEYVNGEIFAMPGGSKGHNLISLNIAMLLRNRLSGSKCNVYVSDVKVHVEEANSFYYPDVLVECGGFDKADLYTKTPTVIFEVVSRSTAMTDRREKSVAYRRLRSLQHYVIVHQTRKQLVIYSRDGDTWTTQEVGSNDVFQLEVGTNPPITISVEDVYADLEFDEGPDLQVREDAETYTW